MDKKVTCLYGSEKFIDNIICVMEKLSRQIIRNVHLAPSMHPVDKMKIVTKK